MQEQTRSRSRWINSDGQFLDLLASRLTADQTVQYISNDARYSLKRVSGRLNNPEHQQVSDASTAIAAHRSGSDVVHDRSDQEPEMDNLTALFRSRCLLYENSILSSIYPHVNDEDMCIISPYIVDNTVSELENLQRQQAEASRVVRRVGGGDDDDYDDDDDDDDYGNETGDATTMKVDLDTASTMSRVPSTNGKHESGMSSSKDEDKRASAERNRKMEERILDFELCTQYYTLEHDSHAMKEQNTLDASDRQVENDIDSIGREKLSAVNFGAANLSLKHLISKIDESREKLAMTDNELRALLSEVRKNRSKWASEEKIGQEELYEAAERVVIELRGYTEHSTAFLNKVTKRDVPDYYNIIKNPMDLGTLMKNLKNIQYKSKTDFAQDVMLIWDNCLTYNADAAHPLRKHAYAMRRKSEQLLAMVPDVTIRDRLEVEAEEFGLPDGDQEEDEEDPEKKVFAGKSTRGTFGPKSKKSKNATQNDVHDGQDTESLDNNQAEKIKQENQDLEVSHSPEAMMVAQKTVAREVGTRDVDGTAVAPASDDEDIDESDLGFQIWRTKTKKARANYASARHRRLRQDTLRPEDPACEASPTFLSGCIISDDHIQQPQDPFEVSTQKELRLLEYEHCSVPDVISLAHDVLPIHHSTVVTETSSFDAPQGGLIEKMRSTTMEMKNIRQLCTKLGTLKLMQDPTMNAFPASYFRQLMEADTRLKFQPLHLEQIGPDVEPCGEDLARALLQKSVCQLLYQSGFEDFQTHALASYTELAGGFLQTIGKLMKQYSETRDKLSGEEVIRHSLYEVGIVDIGMLEDYITDEINGKQEKINSLHTRLKKFLNDFIHGTANVDGDSTGHNIFDENNQDAFVSGSFGDETGEDFFGFRELGLEKEFGMSSLSVPLRLLQGRLRPANAINAALDENGGPGVLRFDRKFPHITKQVAARQIGLFRPYLESKFELMDEEDGDALVEDEELPLRQRKPKPRLGPTGKISKSLHPNLVFERTSDPQNTHSL